jgi:hypothetical protein
LPPDSLSSFSFALISSTVLTSRKHKHTIEQGSDVANEFKKHKNKKHAQGIQDTYKDDQLKHKKNKKEAGWINAETHTRESAAAITQAKSSGNADVFRLQKSLHLCLH